MQSAFVRRPTASGNRTDGRGAELQVAADKNMYNPTGAVMTRRSYHYLQPSTTTARLFSFPSRRGSARARAVYVDELQRLVVSPWRPHQLRKQTTKILGLRS